MFKDIAEPAPKYASSKWRREEKQFNPKKMMATDATLLPKEGKHFTLHHRGSKIPPVALFPTFGQLIVDALTGRPFGNYYTHRASARAFFSVKMIHDNPYDYETYPTYYFASPQIYYNMFPSQPLNHAAITSWEQRE